MPASWIRSTQPWARSACRRPTRSTPEHDTRDRTKGTGAGPQGALSRAQPILPRLRDAFVRVPDPRTGPPPGRVLPPLSRPRTPPPGMALLRPANRSLRPTPEANAALRAGAVLRGSPPERPQRRLAVRGSAGPLGDAEGGHHPHPAARRVVRRDLLQSRAGARAGRRDRHAGARPRPEAVRMGHRAGPDR